MYCTRSALIELIEEVDQIHVDSHLIITELIQWLPTPLTAELLMATSSALNLEMFSISEVATAQLTDTTTADTNRSTFRSELARELSASIRQT